MIFEFTTVRDLVRVSAMHEPTLTEVVVHGPARAGEAALRRLALDRLNFVLRRRPVPSREASRTRDRGSA